MLHTSGRSSEPFPGGKVLLLHQDGRGQKPAVVLMMVYFTDGKSSLVAPLQKDFFHSLLFLQKDVAGSSLGSVFSRASACLGHFILDG